MCECFWLFILSEFLPGRGILHIPKHSPEVKNGFCGSRTTFEIKPWKASLKTGSDFLRIKEIQIFQHGNFNKEKYIQSTSFYFHNLFCLNMLLLKHFVLFLILV